jgi:hypothetical protein
MWWALSQIFVVTTNQSPPDQITYYMTMLQRNAFAEYHTLLGAVAHHGSMGDMLSYIGSRDLPAQNVFPDQNFAREVMQLFSIGLYRLNPDGTPVLDGAGQPIPAYTQDDIIGLAKVWTGLYPDYDDTPEKPYWTRHRLPMVFKSNHHSYAEKRFLGTVLPAYNGGVDNGRFPTEAKVQEMATALDTIAAHPNVAPFISHKLIQRLTSSNPSPGYVRRVATVFTDNGRGVRGDLAAVARAILLDPEARDRAYAETAPQHGKLREEMLLAMPLLRLLDARSVRAGGRIHDHNPNKREINGIYGRISQEPFRAPGVFNYYRPGHVPPNTALGEQGWVSPELQTLDSLSLLQWSRYLGQSLDRDGTGTWRGTGDFRGDNAFDYGALAPLAGDPGRLVATVDELLCGGLLTAPERARITAQVAVIRLDRDRVFSGIRSASATIAWNLSYGDHAGMRFQVAVPGRIVAIRFLRPREETGGHVGRVWTGDGVELGRATFTDESAAGWQEAPLAAPVPVVPGAIYTVGVNVNAVAAFTEGGFFRRSFGSGAVRSATDANGVISYGPLGPFPRYGNYEAHDYHRDVVFEPDPAHAAAMARIMGEVRIKRALFLVMTHPRFLVQR